jgi:hypothetical protein
MTDFKQLLTVLGEARVEYILIGGLAAAAHGAIRATSDLDVVYARNAENYARMVRALAPFAPYLRGVPPGLPFFWDERTIRSGLNFTLTTTLGDIDLLGEIVGGGRFENLISFAETISLFGVECLCIGLEKLIEVKRATGRAKDLLAVAELDRLLERKRERGR